MIDDRESAERFTDEELAFLRFVRFGQLPARVLPDELLELASAHPRPDVPELPFDVRIWGEAGRFL